MGFSKATVAIGKFLSHYPPEHWSDECIMAAASLCLTHKRQVNDTAVLAIADKILERNSHFDSETIRKDWLVHDDQNNQFILRIRRTSDRAGLRSKLAIFMAHQEMVQDAEAFRVRQEKMDSSIFLIPDPCIHYFREQIEIHDDILDVSVGATSSLDQMRAASESERHIVTGLEDSSALSNIRYALLLNAEKKWLEIKALDMNCIYQIRDEIRGKVSCTFDPNMKIWIAPIQNRHDKARAASLIAASARHALLGVGEFVMDGRKSVTKARYENVDSLLRQVDAINVDESESADISESAERATCDKASGLCLAVTKVGDVGIEIELASKYHPEMVEKIRELKANKNFLAKWNPASKTWSIHFKQGSPAEQALIEWGDSISEAMGRVARMIVEPGRLDKYGNPPLPTVEVMRNGEIVIPDAPILHPEQEESDPVGPDIENDTSNVSNVLGERFSFDPKQ
jgi:hypothetical protein